MGAERVLVIGTDTLSRITDWDDRNDRPPVRRRIGRRRGRSGRRTRPDARLGPRADGSALAILHAEVGGKLQMEGKEVFRRAVRIMVESADEVDGCTPV